MDSQIRLSHQMVREVVVLSALSLAIKLRRAGEI